MLQPNLIISDKEDEIHDILSKLYYLIHAGNT
jgi:hypothetical protein